MPDATSPSSEFRRAAFVVAAQRVAQLPADAGREVAFAGRSNAGKSSALNAITGRSGLARVSKTPGRTQQLVVFALDEAGERRLVDLPGYGYAKVPPAMQAQWQGAMDRYFTTRRSLAGLVLIMDVRHPLRDFDRQMLRFCEARRLPVHALLTKADKLKRGRASEALRSVRKDLEGAGFAVSVQLFSALAREGVEEARAVLDRWLAPDEGPEASPDAASVDDAR